MKAIQNILIILIILFLANSCRKNIRDNNTNNQTNNKNSVIDKTDKLEFQKKYLKEGFITRNIYRIVIVSDKRSNEDTQTVKKRAKKRAFVSLQKYLRSENRNVDKNCQAKLLDIINTDGKFSKKEFKNYENIVYYLELKDYLQHFFHQQNRYR